MLDPKYFADKIDVLVKGLERRNVSTDLVERIKDLSSRRKKSITEAEKLKADRNQASAEIAKIKKQGGNADELLARMKTVSDTVKQLDTDLNQIEEEFKALALTIPNIPHESVPQGAGAEQNQVIKTWGEIRKYNFQPKDHVDVAEKLGILDSERAAKVTGARFTILKGVGAKLERALTQFMLDVHTNEHGYTEVWVPLMVNRESLTGTGNLPKFEEDLFKIANTDYFLIPTAEVPVTNIYRDEILNLADLPVKHCAYTPCFRSEVGSYGKDTRGLIRQHQFDKVEVVKFVTPETSHDEHEKLTRDAERILELLELPYRRMLLCTGDMGFSSAKTYDLEVWLPGQNMYREISSCSNFEDFQARRAGIRYRTAQGEKPKLVHTLNGSGLAIGRTWLAILENYQQEDGSVVVPKVLRPYLGLDVIKP